MQLNDRGCCAACEAPFIDGAWRTVKLYSLTVRVHDRCTFEYRGDRL
jgi:hypothetical protein